MDLKSNGHDPRAASSGYEGSANRIEIDLYKELSDFSEMTPDERATEAARFDADRSAIHFDHPAISFEQPQGPDLCTSGLPVAHRPQPSETRLEPPHSKAQQTAQLAAATQSQCGTCGSPVSSDDLFCISCGSFFDELPDEGAAASPCSDCGASVSAVELFCPSCGAALS